MFEWIKKLFKKKKEGEEMNKNQLELLIINFLHSQKRQEIIAAEKYYNGEHDILKRKRVVIQTNERGTREAVEDSTLVNNKIVDNQYSLLVDKKTNYLFSKPLTFKSEDKKYLEEIKKIFNKQFHKQFKYLGENSLNSGIGWLYINYNSDGILSFKIFNSSEILPVWKDSEHEELESVIRIYSSNTVDDTGRTVIKRKVEHYKKDGIDLYDFDKGLKLITSNNPYLVEGEKRYNWEKIPFVAFKYNKNETPLLNRVKSLQDGINSILSNFQNNMEEDPRSAIKVLINYDGTDLGEFNNNLSAYGVIKVNTVDGVHGDVKLLNVEVNAENYKTVLDVFKKSIIENGRGFDAKDERMSNNPNQMNIQSMYSEMDLDANGMETEFQSSFEKVLWFVNRSLGVNKDPEVEIIFNRDILINEAETINNCAKSIGVISQETIISQHPWIQNVEEELEKIKSEKDIYDDYSNKE